MVDDIERLIIAYIPRLRRYARSLLHGHHSLADDLVQDCLERALSRVHQWQPDTDIRAWLFTIMHNIYANQIRRIKSGPEFVELPETMQKSVVDSSNAKLELKELHRALSELPTEQREILLLVTLEGLSYRQVAGILGVPEGTVMSKLFRTRQQLRQLIGREDKPQLRRIK